MGEQLDTSSSCHAQEAPSTSFTKQQTSKAYRIGYSCEYSGSLLRRSRWTAKWSFGIADTQAVQAGKRGDDCRGEEHEVRLIEFPRSKKTRLYWNNRNITHLFRDAVRKLDKVTFAWQARTGQIFQVIARCGPVPQFEFYIDRVSFPLLPLAEELGDDTSKIGFDMSETPVEDHEVELVSPSGEDRSPADEYNQERVESVHSWAHSGDGVDSAVVVDREEDQDDQQQGPANLDFRLSMAGLSPSNNEVVDELRSDLYSPTIDVLRTRITECIPQTEEMVSKAIMNAFFSDDDSHTTMDSLSDDMSDHFFSYSIQLEADAVAEAFEWINSTLLYGADATERRLEFLQRHIDAVMLEIRRDRLCAIDACQLLVSVACVLGLDVNTTARENATVLLVGLDASATVEELSSKLKVYGEIATAGVSSTAGYGLCRYCYPASVGLVTEASVLGEIVIQDKTTQVFSVSAAASASAPSLDSRRPRIEATSSMDEQEEDDYRFENHFDGSPEKYSNTREGVSATVLFTPEKDGHFGAGNMETLMMKTSEVCTSNRTVSTLDSDSETGAYATVRE